MTRNVSRCLPTGLTALLALAGSAFGQNCSNGVNPNQCNPLGNCLGPDVIVGDITGPSNYASDGVIDAFAIGTTSCNIGNTGVTWISGTNQHPVVGQSLYKLRVLADGSSRFEQLGQSWLKHTFFAESESQCCSACQPTDGTSLGVHCSDPYASGRNGIQDGLGPKWQVNAHTGVFPYPPANPPWSGSVARRLQAKVSELEASSATVMYFVSAQYVTQDDAAAGNQNNNESYRPCSITGSGSEWNMALIASTHRASQAIRAWSDTRPATVTSSDVQVPDDGLFIVASEAVSLGGGMYHYEYAVQNMNSDRCGQSFSVPLPAGVTVTNIGFHDVDYHDGDGPGSVNFSGTDWTPSVTNGSVSTGSPISWSSDTFAHNQSANALRWGTIYNFRFDANVAPVGGAATITLFKPGSPASITTAGTSIKVPGTPTPPPCLCDFNGNGILNSQDFFDFVSAFFAAALNADFNHDGIVNSQDFFDFLNCFFAPPPGC
jgi:hypothetical protein